MTDQPTPHRPADAAATSEAGDTTWMDMAKRDREAGIMAEAAEPQDAAMSADEMVAAWTEIVARGHEVIMQNWKLKDETRTWVRIRYPSTRNDTGRAWEEGTDVNPIIAFAKAYAAYRRAQEEPC